MKKLLMILLTSLLVVSCAHKPRFSYEIQPPIAEPGDIVKWCWMATGDVDEYVAVEPDESCPEDALVFSVELGIDFFRDLNHYINELEIRNEVCNKGSTDKPESSPDSEHP